MWTARNWEKHRARMHREDQAARQARHRRAHGETVRFFNRMRFDQHHVWDWNRGVSDPWRDTAILARLILSNS